MKYLILLSVVLLFLPCCKSPDPEPVKVGFPDGTKSGSSQNNLTVTVSADDRIYIGNKEVPQLILDSTLGAEIENRKKRTDDTISVVINADSASSYGMVFSIIRIAKKNSAKAVATIEP